ncbi:MAG TPA: DUF5906 domain-containing protein [Stenomitos sp.]
MVASIERTQTTDSAIQSPGIDGATRSTTCKGAFVEQRQKTIDWLTENGYPALPVAPIQPADKYPLINKKTGAVELDKDGNPKPRFTGKNPSYLDKAGIPHLVTHSKYHDKLPTQEDLSKWFANPLNGVGTLGGWNNAIWIDFDVKNFDSDKECEDAALDCSELIEEQFGAPFIEKTHSGGWRIGVCVEEPPSFTNFCIEEGGEKIGEALFKGRFTVLAPTVGVSGNLYENVNRVKLPVVKNLEAIGIYPTSSKKQNNPILRTVEVNYSQIKKFTDSISLEEICSRKSKDVLAGNNIHDDRSESLTMAIKEWYGWINWCADNKVFIYGSVENLAFQAGRNLGIDDDRISRILKTVANPDACVCASFYNGKDKSCWQKVRHYNWKVFDKSCPAELKSIINKEIVDYAQHINDTSSSEKSTKSIQEGEISKDEYYRLQAEKTNATISQIESLDFEPIDVIETKSKPSKDNPPEKITKEIKKAFCQQVYDELFQDNNYIYVHNQFHKWTGTHYEPMAIAVITKKIHDYCDTYEVIKEKTITYPYATPSFVTMALSWLKQKFGIDPKLINPPGLNCIDGILQLSFDPDSKTLIKTLVPHDPSFYYLYAPQATYHISPITLPDPCNRLLSCLDAPQRDIFLKTIGAAFDLPTVRRYKGRGIKALLLHGTGSNGKDTLRHVTSMMFGCRGMVSVSFADFLQYDQGRKFPAQKLDGALVNWPSENGDNALLDKIQSLKIAITGDPLSGEKKGKDEYEFHPKCVHLFNYNLPPKLQGSMQAILDRFAILKFNKTYKTNPAPGELQADPRFLYDPEFVRTEVLPWYLYYCLDALERLMKEGVNYDVTEQAWEDLRVESDHIYAFCQEVGIGYKRSGQLSTDEVYNALRNWYIENGTLEVQTLGTFTKDNWSPNPAGGDSLIKGKNQIFTRLLKIFPEARRERDSSGRYILVGVGWISPTPPDGEKVSLCYSSEDGLKLSEDGLKMLKPLQSQHSEDAEDAEDVLTDSVKNFNFKIEESCGCGGKCPACFAESAKNLANAMLRCESGKEVRELLEQYSHLSEAAWRSLTEEGHDHVRGLLLKLEVEETELKTEDYKEGSPPLHHLQHLQNVDSIKVSTSSDHLQPSSDHLQNCSKSIQNQPIDFSDIMARTNIEIKRLGWTPQQGKDYLLRTYGKRSRQMMTDPELVDFLNYLQSLPTPQPENSVGDEEVQPEQVELIEEAVEEPQWTLPQETDEIETAAELEYSPAQYSIYLSENDSELGCTFVQRIGNICQFACGENDTIDLEVGEDDKFVGGVIVEKME